MVAARLFRGPFVAAAACCFLLSGVGVADDNEEGEPSFFIEGPPPFFDYDCDLANSMSSAATDWNAVFARVALSADDAKNASSFIFPAEFKHLVEGPLSAQAKEECPLGVLYLLVLYYYDGVKQGAAAEEKLWRAQGIQEVFQQFPVYTVALSRWPVFFALEHFSPWHQSQYKLFCDDVEGVLDWGAFRQKTLKWADGRRSGEELTDEDLASLEEMEREIAAEIHLVLTHRTKQEAAQDECEYGFYFLVASQVVAAANHETQYLPPYNAAMDHIIANVPFVNLAACGWPIFAILVIFQDLNKGIWFFGGDRKYLRGYSDWNLRRDELSPLLPTSLDFLTPDWSAAARNSVSTLLGLPADEYEHIVRARAAERERVSGSLRPIIRNLLDVAIAISAATTPKGLPRLAYMVLLYGASWSVILERLAGRLHSQLGVQHPLLVIAIGPEASATCERLHQHGPEVVCWTPDSQSQVHRFTALHVLLHLGIDIIYVDMDTFMVRDPTPRILAQAVDKDALFARHADADCVNIGVFYLRAGPETAVWFSQYITWYHDHPFEIDQRGIHVFLRLPAEKLKIAYPPVELVEIRAGVLDDVNEIVIGDVGWHGMYSKLLIMHWCHRPIDLKEQEIMAAYDAADAVTGHGIPLAVAVETIHMAADGSPWAKVLLFRDILETYRKEAPPERGPCW